MSNLYSLRILTPAGLQFEGRVKAVKVVSSNGEIGVLAGHVKYTGILGTGILEYEGESSGTSGKVVVSGGFCNFADGTLTVLADSVDFPDAVDRAQVSKAKPELERILATESTDSGKWVVAKADLERIEAIEKLTVH